MNEDDERPAHFCTLESLGRRVLGRGIPYLARTYEQAEEEVLDLYPRPEERSIFLLAAILDALLMIIERLESEVGDQPKGETDGKGAQRGSPSGS